MGGSRSLSLHCTKQRAEIVLQCYFGCNAATEEKLQMPSECEGEDSHCGSVRGRTGSLPVVGAGRQF